MNDLADLDKEIEEAEIRLIHDLYPNVTPEQLNVHLTKWRGISLPIKETPVIEPVASIAVSDEPLICAPPAEITPVEPVPDNYMVDSGAHESLFAEGGENGMRGATPVRQTRFRTLRPIAVADTGTYYRVMTGEIVEEGTGALSGRTQPGAIPSAYARFGHSFSTGTVNAARGLGWVGAILLVNHARIEAENQGPYHSAPMTFDRLWESADRLGGALLHDPGLSIYDIRRPL